MLMRLLKYLQGYLRIEIQGFSPERFFNLCTSRKILLWNISKEKDRYYCNISIKSFKKLKQITRKTRTHIHILEKHGLIFQIKKSRHRTCFFLGILAAVSLLTFISFFIWNIKISGNYRHSTEELMAFLKEHDISAGKSKRDLDNEEIVRLLRTEFDDITWVSVEIKGTRLYIELRENTTKESAKDLPDGEASDLIAGKDGEILKIVTRTGTPCVKKGDKVTADTILVSGRLAILNDAGEVSAYQYCHADADIYLRYEYVYQDSFPLLHIEKNYTAREQKHLILSFAGKNFRIGRKNSYETYDTTEHSYPLQLFPDFYLPITFTTETFREYKAEEKNYSNKEALLLGKERLHNFCENLQEKGVQIVENNVKIQCDGKNCFSAGTLILVETVTTRKATEILAVPKEDNVADESIGVNH